MSVTKRPLFDPPIVRRAMRDAFVKLESAAHGAEPGDVRRAARQRRSRRSCCSATSRGGRGDIGFTLQIALWLWFTVLFANFAEAMAEGRGKAQADTLRHVAHADDGQAARRDLSNRRDDRGGPGDQLRRGDLVLCMPGRRDPGRRRSRRGRRVGRRVGDHRRIGAGHPRVRRRSLGRHRRHEGAVRLPRHPHHRQPGRDLPRPDDRAGRRRLAAEDAERDRAHDPAVGPDDHLPACRRHAAAVRDLLAATRCRFRS